MNRVLPFSFPDKQTALLILKHGTVSTFAFTVIYFFCNSAAARSATHYPLYFDWELSIPLIPWMIYPYLSLNGLLFLSAFVVKKEAVKGLCLSITYSVMIAGIFFYFFPGKLGFVREAEASGLFKSMHEIDHPHNLFPSLHITYSALCVWAMIQQTKQAWFHGVLWIWLLMISASVILVHQHHIVDIVTGFILAIIMYRLVFRPMTLGQSLRQPDITED